MEGPKKAPNSKCITQLTEISHYLSSLKNKPPTKHIKTEGQTEL